jgi:hypothetical protein
VATVRDADITVVGGSRYHEDDDVVSTPGAAPVPDHQELA